jgi:tRNA(adenine34) deaminase
MNFKKNSSLDIAHMQAALVLARKAFDAGEVPIGAIIVAPDGTIIGRGYNQIEQRGCQDQHAEINAIRAACTHTGSWRLDGCTLYVTLEPCIMCIGCIALSRVERLVYATESPIYGYQGRREDICRLYDGAIKNVTIGPCRDQAEKLLQEFFRQQRQKP